MKDKPMDMLNANTIKDIMFSQVREDAKAYNEAYQRGFENGKSVGRIEAFEEAKAMLRNKA